MSGKGRFEFVAITYDKHCQSDLMQRNSIFKIFVSKYTLCVFVISSIKGHIQNLLEDFKIRSRNYIFFLVCFS